MKLMSPLELFRNGAAESVLDEWDATIRFGETSKIRYRACKGGL